MSIRLPDITRVAYCDIEAFDLYRVFQRHGYSSERTLQVDLILRPLFSFRKQYLGDTIRLLMRLGRYLAVCSQDIDGTSDLLVYILDELLDGLPEYGPFLRGEWVSVWLRETRDLGRSF